MLIELPKSPVNVASNIFFLRIMVFLPGFLTFSLLVKLLKMSPKMAAESPFRGAKPRWLPLARGGGEHSVTPGTFFVFGSSNKK